MFSKGSVISVEVSFNLCLWGTLFPNEEYNSKGFEDHVPEAGNTLQLCVSLT